MAGAGLLAAVVLAACGPPVRLPLEGPGDGPTTAQSGELTITVDAQAEGSAAHGWDLAVDLDLAWYGQATARVDLTRTLVRVDGMRWSACRVPTGAPPLDSLLLEPGAKAERTLTCADIPRPDQALELRLHTSGTGGTGVVEVRLSPGAPVPLPAGPSPGR